MIQEVLGTTPVPTPATVSPNERAILLGCLLSLPDVGSIVLVKDEDILGAVYGYQLIVLCAQFRSNPDIYKLLWSPIQEVLNIITLEDIPRVRTSDKIEHIMAEIIGKRFGDVIIVDEGNRPVGLVSLPELMQGLSNTSEKTGTTVRSVASPLKTLPEDSSLREAMTFMLRNRARRVVLKREDKYYGVTEREILKYLFSMQGLTLVRDNSNKSLDVSVDDALKHSWQDIPSVSGDIDIVEGWKIALSGGNLSLIVDQEKIATPWDLVIKPYVGGHLRL